MARALLITVEVQAAIRALREKASAEAIPMRRMEEITWQVQNGTPFEGFTDFTLEIPEGYRVIYTVEHHRPGPVRHLSVSIDADNKMPHVEAVKLLMEQFGFVLPLDKVFFCTESTLDGRQAVNVIEPLDGNTAPFLKAHDA